MKLLLVSYNILFGHDPKVFDSLEDIYKTHKVTKHAFITLQEVRRKSATDWLPENIIHMFRGFFASSFLYPAPSLNHLGLLTLSSLAPTHEYRHQLPKRRNFGALCTTYKIRSKTLRITNVHLDFLGGIRRKKIEISSISGYLKKHPVDCDVVCGDFNTIGPLRFMTKRVERQKKLILSHLGPTYSEVYVPKWTSDVTSVISPLAPASKLVHALLKKTGIQFRQKLDWVFVKGFKKSSATVRHDLMGSDHYPVFAELEI